MKTKSRMFAAAILGLATGLTLGQGTPFNKITTGDIIHDLGSWVGGVWADFNNDGF